MKSGIVSSKKRFRDIRLLAGIVLILVSAICFYSKENVNVFILVSLIGMGFLAAEVLYIDWRVVVSPCIVWLLSIYGMFTINGLFRLRTGDYNWDFMFFTCIENILLYIGLKRYLKGKSLYIHLKQIMIPVSIISLVYFIVGVAFDFDKGTTIDNRMGGFMSGNVNTVAGCFGVLSMFLAFLYITRQKKGIFILWGLVSVASLLTGSKAAVVFGIITLFYFMNAIDYKRRIKMMVVVLIIFAISLYTLFATKYLYELIGFRIQDMVHQLLGVGGGNYSHSTDVRRYMILEAFSFFCDHPIIGGGTNYFGLRTATKYPYSHSNVTEILCNMGVVGILLYYGPQLLILIKAFKYKKNKKQYSSLIIYLLFSRFITDWIFMTHSEICIGYLPAIMSFIIAERLKNYRKLSSEEGRVATVNV